MQITPDTADTIETLSGGETFVFEDLANPDLNIRYGTFYLNHLLDRFGGNEVAALAGVQRRARERGGVGRLRRSRSTTSSFRRRGRTSRASSSSASSTGRTTPKSSGWTDGAHCARGLTRFRRDGLAA